MTEDPYYNFKELLKANHQFPMVYLLKFIGKNSRIFLESVTHFEIKFTGLQKVGEKQSASGRHLSLTYEYQAPTAEDVVELNIQCHKINDLIYLL
ncbi:MAG: DUF493 family protein [Bdellovibrionales bacterium]|nr:DUF493 family protein [Oligoflexia bacterium]